MCDTKYFKRALDEQIAMRPENFGAPVSSMTCGQLSILLKRAQELKDADAAARDEERGKKTTDYYQSWEESR